MVRGSLILALLVVPGLAHADRVVVGTIRGDESERIRGRLEAALRERVDLVPWSEFRAAYHGLEAEAIREACQAVDVQAIVLGDVVTARQVDLLAISCATGETAVETHVALRRGVPVASSLDRALGTMFFDQGADALMRWALRPRSGVSASPAPAEPPETAEPGDAEPAETEEPPPEPEYDDEPAPAQVEPAIDEESQELASLFGRREDSLAAEDDVPAEPAVQAELPAPVPRTAILELQVGATFANRSLEIIDRSGAALTYSGGGYTEIGVTGTLFPLAIVSSRPWARVIGVTAAFAKGIAVEPSSEDGLDVDTVDGAAGLLGRIRLGRSPVELRPQVAYGWRGFAIDPNPDLATFNYRFLRAALEVRISPLESARPAEGTVGRLTLGVYGGGRLVTELGDAALAYGADATGTGYDIGGFLSVLFGKSFEVTTGAELVGFSSTFAGDGSLQRLAESSTDLYPRAFLRAGVSLH